MFTEQNKSPQREPTALQLPATKLATATATMIEHSVSSNGSSLEAAAAVVTTMTPYHQKDMIIGRKADVMHVLLRMTCMVTSLTALSFMVTAKQSSVLVIYGFQLPIKSKWSFSNSFEYLVGISGAVAIHSFLQLLIGSTRLLRGSSVIPSRNYAWLIFAADQVFAYALISAASAASGVTNLNRTGIRHTALPNLCKPLQSFCDHVTVSIAFTFFSCMLIATSAVLNVIWLSKY